MNPWIALVGRHEDGKDEVVECLQRHFHAQQMQWGGAVQCSIEREGECVGYDLRDVGTAERWPLARVSRDPRLCNWGFEPEAFDRAGRCALDSANAACIIEVGALERSGEGNWTTVEAALSGMPQLVILAVRPRILTPIVLTLPDPAFWIELPADALTVEQFGRDAAEAAAAIAKGNPLAPSVHDACEEATI